jgi:hypothetical protein
MVRASAIESAATAKDTRRRRSDGRGAGQGKIRDVTTNNLDSRCEAQKDRIIKIAMNAGHAGIYFGTAEEPHAVKM